MKLRSAAVLVLALALVQPLAHADCKKLGEKELVRIDFKPDTEFADVIGWYSMLACIPMLVGTPIKGKKVTILSPEPITMAEVRRLFYDTLDSVGLTAEQ